MGKASARVASEQGCVSLSCFSCSSWEFSGLISQSIDGFLAVIKTYLASAVRTIIVIAFVSTTLVV